MMMAGITELIYTLLGGTTVASVLLIYFALNPEKIEKWAAIFWKILQVIPLLWAYANKKYVKHDIQGRVNDFAKRLRKLAPALPNVGVRIEWSENRTSRKAFLDKGEVLICMPKADREAVNFVNAAMMFISKVVAFRAKRYISAPQGDALDLYAGYRLLQEEKPEMVDYFLEEWLHVKVGKATSKTSDYFRSYDTINDSGLLFPLYVHQLDVLGRKVFGKRKDQRIITEVDEVIDFLQAYSQRVVGKDDTRLNYSGRHCRFGIVIVGKRRKRFLGTKIYERYIRSMLVKLGGIEYIYIVGPAENRDMILDICADGTVLLEPYLQQLFFEPSKRTCRLAEQHVRPQGTFNPERQAAICRMKLSCAPDERFVMAVCSVTVINNCGHEVEIDAAQIISSVRKGYRTEIQGVSKTPFYNFKLAFFAWQS